MRAPPNWCAVFDLPPGRKLRHLSRGMRMKAALVSSLAYRPALLVLDEPFSGLDPLVREDLIEGVLESAGETTILSPRTIWPRSRASSATSAYLDGGRLQFAEEMASLSARFREVEVTVEPPAALPDHSQWPAHWLRPEKAAALVRFVETRFDPERTTADIRRVFAECVTLR